MNGGGEATKICNEIDKNMSLSSQALNKNCKTLKNVCGLKNKILGPNTSEIGINIGANCDTVRDDIKNEYFYKKHPEIKEEESLENNVMIDIYDIFDNDKKYIVTYNRAFGKSMYKNEKKKFLLETNNLLDEYSNTGDINKIKSFIDNYVNDV